MYKPVTLLVIAMVAGVTTSLWLWHDLRAERGRTEELRARILELERIQTAAALHVDASTQAEAPAVSTSSSTPVRQKTSATASVPPPSAGNEQSTHDTRREYERRLLRNPEYREAWRVRRRMELATGLVDLAASLQTSQAEVDQLIDLLVERELRYADQPHPNPTNEEEMQERQRQIAESQRAQDAELATLFGSETAARWKEYQDSMSSRQQVYQLRKALSASTDPLREDQIEPLISAVYAEQKQFNQELRDFTATLTWSDGMEEQSHLRRNERYVELATAAYKRIHAAAGSVLSSQQLEQLDRMLQRQLEMTDAQFRMQRAQSGMAERGKLDMAKSN